MQSAPSACGGSARPGRAMARRLVLLSVVLSALAYGADTDSRVHRLSSRFVAPCCWHENLSVHTSPLAEELRGEIRGRVAAGETDEQIKVELIHRFGLRILAEPEGTAGLWLTWIPWLISAAGMLTVTWLIWRSAGRLQPDGTLPAAIDIPDSDWE